MIDLLYIMSLFYQRKTIYNKYQLGETTEYSSTMIQNLLVDNLFEDIIIVLVIKKYMKYIN